MAEHLQRRCCCGCCTVRTGTIVIGVSWLLLNAVSIAAYAWHLCVLSDPDEGNPWKPWWEKYDKMMADAGYPDYGDIPMVKEIREKIDDAYINHRQCLVIFSWVAVTCGLLSIIFSVKMLVGAIKNDPNRRWLVIPWLVYNIIGTIVGLALCVLIVIYFGVHFSVMIAVVAAVEYVVVFGFYGYLFWVVWLYIKELKLRAQEQAGFDAVGLIKK